MNAQQYARAWNKRVRDYEPRMRAEFRAIGDLALSVSDRLLTEEVYSKPEDVSPSGRPKWRRTNLLAVSEVEHLEEDGTRIVLENLTDYGEPRHEANKPGRRRINPYRTAHWRDDMLDILAAEVPERLMRVQAGIMRET